MRFATALVVAICGSAAAQSADPICIEALAGVCLKYEEGPTDRFDGQTVSPEETAERILDLTRNDQRQVQVALRDRALYRGQIDGVFDAGTRDAIRRFQNTLGRVETGYLDQDVLDRLIPKDRRIFITDQEIEAEILLAVEGVVCSLTGASGFYTVEYLAQRMFRYSANSVLLFGQWGYSNGRICASIPGYPVTCVDVSNRIRQQSSLSRDEICELASKF